MNLEREKQLVAAIQQAITVLHTGSHTLSYPDRITAARTWLQAALAAPEEHEHTFISHDENERVRCIECGDTADRECANCGHLESQHKADICLTCATVPGPPDKWCTAYRAKGEQG